MVAFDEILADVTVFGEEIEAAHYASNGLTAFKSGSLDPQWQI